MIYLLLCGVLAALVFSGVGAFCRINPWSQGPLGIVSVLAIPILLGNAALLFYFQKAPNFTMSFFFFNGLYALAGLVAGVVIFKESISIIGWVGVGMIVLGSILLRR